MRRKIFNNLLIGLVVLVLAGFGLQISAEEQDNGVANNLGIYGGNNWDIAVDGDYVYTIADGSPNGFFYSSDAGLTWQQPVGDNDFGSGQAVEVDPTTGDVYVGLGGDLYKSTDHGATLTLIKENAGNPLVFGLDTVIAGWNNELRVSTDAGATFTDTSIADAHSLSYLASSATDGVFYAVGEDNDGLSVLYTSADNGLTWTTMTPSFGAETYTNFQAVHTNPFDATEMALADDHSAWLSFDSGATFTEITNAPASCNNIVTWAADDLLYACSSYSADDGATWAQMDFDALVRGPGKILVVNPLDANILYADSMSGVTKSVDGGTTWVNAYDGILGVNVLDISTTADKTVAWTSSSQGLAKSVDFNAETPTWEFPILPCAVGRCDPSGIGDSVWVKPDDANIVLAGSIGGYIFLSTDAGATWVLAEIENADDAKFIDPDSGMSSVRPYQFVSDPNDSSIIYAALSGPEIGEVVKSTDSGATWEDLAITDDAPAKALAINSAGVLYVETGFSTSTIKGMYKYEADVWTEVAGFPLDEDAASIVIDPDDENIIYASTTQNFYKSIDAGVTWTAITGLEDYYNFAAISLQDSTSPNTLYLSCRDNDWHGILLKSSDQGETWGVMYSGLKSETFNTLVFDDLLAGTSTGLYELKSKATLTIKAHHSDERISIKSKLKDATTDKVLKNKKVKLYRQIKHKGWRYFRTLTTNSLGAINAHVKVNKTAHFKAIWTPKNNFAHEYTRAVSRTITIHS